MRAIAKGQEPHSLTVHRRKPHSDYDNYGNKNALRKALAAEQRGLCCYCMGRIRPVINEMKIEHWRSRSCHPGEQLSYRNLLGACRGGEGAPRALQHCDTRKGDDDLRWNPAEPDDAIEARVRCDPDGAIRSNDDEFDAQLNEVLNLNLPFLKNNRKGVLDALADWWRARRGAASRQEIERRRGKFANGSRDLPPYCQVAVWWLDRKLAQRHTTRQRTR